MDINKVYNNECISFMASMCDEFVKCIITSPPYYLGGDFLTFVDGKRVTYGDYTGFADKLPEEEYRRQQLELLNECYRVTKNDGYMFYNHKNRIINGTTSSPLEWILQSKWNLAQIVVLDFGATANVDKRRFFPVHELLFILSKDTRQKLNNSDCYTDVWKMKKVPRKISGHPATFDIELPNRCIKASTEYGDLVFDPYSGTGTTLLSARQLGRQFIGCEISKEYIDLINKRMEPNLLIEA